MDYTMNNTITNIISYYWKMMIIRRTQRLELKNICMSGNMGIYCLRIRHILWYGAKYVHVNPWETAVVNRIPLNSCHHSSWKLLYNEVKKLFF